MRKREIEKGHERELAREKEGERVENKKEIQRKKNERKMERESVQRRDSGEGKGKRTSKNKYAKHKNVVFKPRNRLFPNHLQIIGLDTYSPSS